MNTRNLRLFRHDEALVSWDNHANMLGTVLKLVEAITDDSPCECGLCGHCTRLALLQVELRTAIREATDECNELAIWGCICPSMFPQTAA